jgi:hypothetical protein
LFVKPMRATALSTQRATRRSPWRSIRFEVVGDNSLVFMDYMFPGIRETTALLPIRGGSSAVASRHHRNNALVRPQHVAVRRHKVTTLEHLFGARAQSIRTGDHYGRVGFSSAQWAKFTIWRKNIHATPGR